MSLLLVPAINAIGNDLDPEYGEGWDDPDNNPGLSGDDSLSGPVEFCKECGQEYKYPEIEEKPPVPRSERWTGFLPGLHDDL